MWEPAVSFYSVVQEKTRQESEIKRHLKLQTKVISAAF